MGRWRAGQTDDALPAGLATRDWVDCTLANGERRCALDVPDGSGGRIDAVIFPDDQPRQARVVMRRDDQTTTIAPSRLLLAGGMAVDDIAGADPSAPAVLLDGQQRALVGRPRGHRVTLRPPHVPRRPRARPLSQARPARRRRQRNASRRGRWSGENSTHRVTRGFTEGGHDGVGRVGAGGGAHAVRVEESRRRDRAAKVLSAPASAAVFQSRSRTQAAPVARANAAALSAW